MNTLADTEAHALAVRMLTDPDTALAMAIELQQLRRREALRYEIAAQIDQVADAVEFDGLAARAERLRILAVSLART